MTGKSYAHFPIRTGLEAVHRRIAAAASAAGRRAEDVRLIAVSKAFPAQAVHEAVRCGQRAFGENYAQEAVAKIVALESLLHAESGACGNQNSSADADPTRRARPTRVALEWHFIGPVQSNKTKLIAEHFHWVHSVDRLRVAERLAAQRPSAAAPLMVCIEVNVSGESSKSGVAPAALAELAQQIARLPRLKLRGLMTIPAPSANADALRRQFRALRELRDDVAAARGVLLDTLSMGMSEDLEIAIAEGATMVRVGRAIFGERPAN